MRRGWWRGAARAEDTTGHAAYAHLPARSCAFTKAIMACSACSLAAPYGLVGLCGVCSVIGNSVGAPNVAHEEEKISRLTPAEPIARSSATVDTYATRCADQAHRRSCAGSGGRTVMFWK
eukprot:scaffold52426_cov27-Tisochrysis_lutea.AAC.2